MAAQFSISVDAPRDLVRIAMGGFFSDADIGDFRLTLESEMAALRCAPNQHVTLVDIRAMKIQTQEIVGAFSTVVGHPMFRSRRLAFVTASSLARLQARRLTDRPGVQFFTDVAEAQAWLMA